jgi:hypothetical protein
LYSPVSADDLDIINRWGPGCFGDIAQGEQVIGCNSADVIPADLPLNLQTAYLNTASDAEALKQVAAYYHLDYVTAPIQIHYGTEDGKFLSGTPPEWWSYINMKAKVIPLLANRGSCSCGAC